MSRTIVSSIGLSAPLRMSVSLIGVLTGPRIFSTASSSFRPRTDWPSIFGNIVASKNASLGGGRIVDRGDDLDEFVFHRDFDAEAAEFTLGLGAHVFGILRIHVARMRIERRKHAVDGTLDQLVFLRAA